MAIRFYDEALVQKIEKWVKDTNMKILKPDEVSRLFQMKVDEGQDSPIKLPFIALSRDRDITILNTQKQVKTFDGFVIQSNEKTSVTMNAIPIDIGYQLDIYTKGQKEADEYLRNFIFNFINLPNLKITIPYNNMNVEHYSTIHLGNTVYDNSDVAEKLFPDQFTRYTLLLNVDDAYLFSLPIKDNVVMEIVEFDAVDRTTQKVVEHDEDVLSIHFDSNEVLN